MKLLFFRARWCGPCNQMLPGVNEIFDIGQVKERYSLERIDIDEDIQTADKWVIRAVPAFIIVDEQGKELARHIGAWPKYKMMEWMMDNSYKGLTTASNPAELCNLPKKEKSMLKTIKKMLGMGVDSEMVGSISTFAGTYAPIGYMDCDGQLLSITSYNALYAVLGPRYGGDGKTNFALPDLRPMGKDSQPDTGHNHRVDWNTLGIPRQVICVVGYWPSRP